MVPDSDNGESEIAERDQVDRGDLEQRVRLLIQANEVVALARPIAERRDG